MYEEDKMVRVLTEYLHGEMNALELTIFYKLLELYRLKMSQIREAML